MTKSQISKGGQNPYLTSGQIRELEVATILLCFHQMQSLDGLKMRTTYLYVHPPSYVDEYLSFINHLCFHLMAHIDGIKICKKINVKSTSILCLLAFERPRAGHSNYI